MRLILGKYEVLAIECMADGIHNEAPGRNNITTPTNCFGELLPGSAAVVLVVLTR